MPKISAETSAIQKTFEAAQENVKNAKKKHETTNTEASKKALDAARAKSVEASKAVCVERFDKLGTYRVNKILEALDVLAQCSNRKSYEYTETKIAKAMKAIREKVEQTDAAFTNALKAPVGETKTVSQGFSF